ncbi:hypothetical protein BJX66DRAFT_312226 [Aspergillus keveii]|uniref:Uncharacterized protein n=1 Tax=Aspergillus keveii TaxID=714993 RepID=A0ABR4FTX7_9EURO
MNHYLLDSRSLERYLMRPGLNHPHLYTSALTFPPIKTSNHLCSTRLVICHPSSICVSTCVDLFVLCREG